MFSIFYDVCTIYLQIATRHSSRNTPANLTELTRAHTLAVSLQIDYAGLKGIPNACFARTHQHKRGHSL